MAKVILDSVTGGYDLSKINANFSKLANELNEKVAYRQVEEGEPNTVEVDLDINNKFLYNLPEPVLDHHPATKQFVVNSLAVGLNPLLLLAQEAASDAQDSANAAAVSEGEAEDAAAAALVSEGLAAASAGLAANYAQLSNLVDYGSITELSDYTTDYGVII